MKKSILSSIGAMVALAFCSVMATAAPLDGLLFEVAYEVSAEPVAYESVSDVDSQDIAALAALTEDRMPSPSASLVGDAGSETILAALNIQEAGVSTAGTKAVTEWSIV